MKKFICLFFIPLILLSGIAFKLYASEFSDLEEINAVSAIALEVNSGKILYAKNPHLKIPPASTVKLVTAMVVLDKLSLDQKITISKNASQIPSVAPKLMEGEVYTVLDLLYFMLLKSSNQAAVALAEAVAGSEESFSYLMNKKIKSLGLKDSNFVNSSGLPTSNQYSTAYELSLILYEALKYPLIKEIINTPVKIISSQQGRILVIKNTNSLLEDPEFKSKIIGGKTGYTQSSRHCLVNIAVLESNHLIITSLLGVPSREGLWEETKKLLKFSQLVLEKKVSPVIINTAVNTNLWAGKKPVSYKKVKKSSYVSQKNSKKKLYLKSSKKSKKIVVQKSNFSKNKKFSKNVKINKSKS
ncbi:MAG: serine hydrolase [Thermodesulfobacteriaceae bacterium]|nr:serine hydrolase [Thermodesulfobacteriaceae bacterium]MDW8136072.1 serine hydrolase [Thermodesulfobacterium sp.]